MKTTGRDLALRCSCGTVQGRVADMRNGFATRLNCFCRDCRAFLAHTGAVDCVDKNGAAELFVTLPGRVSFHQGQDQLKVLRLSKKGILRWYAGCCGTPMGNVIASQKILFTSLPLAAIPDKADRKILGRLAASINSQAAPPGSSPVKDYGAGRLFYAICLRHISVKLKRGPAGTPYFDEDGTPVKPVHILDRTEKAQAYQGLA